MAEQVRIGIVGTSWWADLVHLPNLHGYPRAVLAAICGRSRERADEMARKYGIPLVFTDYRAMIETGGLDAVVISVPDDLHYPMVMGALDARLHILCEKPLALNVIQARAMCEKAEAAGVAHMVFYTWRWTPLQHCIRQLLDEGYIGRCYDCQMVFHGGFARSGEYGWRYDRQRSNGVWGDLGSHMIDLTRWYVGEIEAVSAHLTMFTDHPGEDGRPMELSNDSAVAALRFTGGAHGTLNVSTVRHIGSRVMEQRIMLYGEDGTLEGRMTFGEVELYGARKDEPDLHPIPIPDSLWGDSNRSNALDVFQHQRIGGRLFVDAILDGAPASPDFYDGLKAQEVIDAGMKANESGQWMNL